MTRVRWFGAIVLAGLLAAPAAAQPPLPKPGPEHEVLKKHVGTWDLTMKFGGMETKGTSTYKMDLGGMWLSSTVESEIFGMKFQGHGMDSYDATKKKYVSAWFDRVRHRPFRRRSRPLLPASG
jgi:hypothetical protein